MERRAALTLQKAWTQFASLQAKARSQFAGNLTPRSPPSGQTFKRAVTAPGRDGRPSGELLPGSPGRSQSAVNAQLKDMSLQLREIKKLLETNNNKRSGRSGRLTPKGDQTSSWTGDA